MNHCPLAILLEIPTPFFKGTIKIEENLMEHESFAESAII